MKLVFTIEAPDVVAEDALVTFAARHGYTETVIAVGNKQVPNPLSISDYAKVVISRFVLESIISKKMEIAQEQTRIAVLEATGELDKQAEITLEIT